MIWEGEAAIPLETTRSAFLNQEKSKQWSAIVLNTHYPLPWQYIILRAEFVSKNHDSSFSKKVSKISQFTGVRIVREKGIWSAAGGQLLAKMQAKYYSIGQ